MTRRIAAVAGLVCWLMAAPGGAPSSALAADAPALLDVGSGKQLFVDESMLQSRRDVELLDEGGKELPGFSGADAPWLIANSVRLLARWSRAEELHRLAGRTIRIRFMLRDAKLYAFQFRGPR